MGNILLKNILDDEFLETLAKSADLYKIGSNSVLDPIEIMIGLRVVPRAVMSMLMSELMPMAINTSKEIPLPFGADAFIRVNKNASDDYTGSVYSKNKLVYDFQNRSIPGLGVILLTTFELYDVEKLADKKPEDPAKEDIDKKVQKLIDERMELHSLVGKVVEEKMAQREAIHKLMMSKLNEVIATKSVAIPPIATSAPSIATLADGRGVGPIEVKPSDIAKKEATPKKGSPLKVFLERKKKPKILHHVEILKSETIYCNDCGQAIFNGKSGYSGCICFGENANSKIFLKKTENDGIMVSFSRNWSGENIEMLLEALRKGK